MAIHFSNTRALMLDLDGTLVDSAPDIMRVVNITLTEAGREPLDLHSIHMFVGNGIPSLVERAFEATGGIPETDQLHEHIVNCIHRYKNKPVVDTVLYEGVAETLKQLHNAGMTMAVCTNKMEFLASQILRELHIDQYFSAVVGGDTLETKKPSGKHLIYTMEKMGSNKDNTVMVGDSENDILAANNADVPAILVNYGYNQIPLNELKTDYVIEQFNQLSSLLEQHDTASV